MSLILLICIFGIRAASAETPALGITVGSAQGEVHVTGQDRQLEVHKGDEVPLPATIYTGPSGSIELRQGNTSVSVAPNSQLLIPAPAIAGEVIDRVVQSRGNAFYSVAKRKASKLHVESAYLVAVVKGTQFSVVAQDESATISLFEGRLEVRATDGSDVVDLHAGEIAVRHANDSAIRMLGMDTGGPVAHRSPPASPAGTTSGQGLALAAASNPEAAGGEAGEVRGTSADRGGPGLGSPSGSFSGGVAAGLGSGSSSVSDVLVANLGNKSANASSGGGNPGNGHGGANDGNGQGGSNGGGGQSNSGSGNGQNASGNGNGQGAGNNGNGNGQSAGNNGNGNGQSAGSNGNGNGNGQGAGNNGNAQNASGNGNGQGAGNNGNGNGQGAGNNGNGQNNSNNGNGQDAPDKGNGHHGSNKAAFGRSLNIGNGAHGGAGTVSLNRGNTNALTQTTGANLGIGTPAGGAANSTAVGGLLGGVMRHKGSSVQP